MHDIERLTLALVVAAALRDEPQTLLSEQERTYRKDRTPTHGYAASRENSMVAFAKSWRRE
jgi:hypothetical protein